MNTFYSIIYTPIRSAADERMSIGLFLKSDDQIYFRYSHDKLKIIHEFLPDPAYRLLRSYLKNFEIFFQKRLKNKQEKSTFNNFVSDNPDFINPSYINYLNKYGHNLLHFSQPINLNIEINQEVYNKLFHTFIYESDQIIEQDLTIYEKVRHEMNPVIQKHVNIDIKLTSNEIENLVVPTKVWFIGQNEVDVTGEVFDFEKKTYHLEHEITKHLNLVTTLQVAPHYGKSTHFIVGKEPSRNNKDNHSLWNNIRKLDYVKYVPYNELNEISHYLIKHHVTPYVANVPTDDNISTVDDLPF